MSVSRGGISTRTWKYFYAHVYSFIHLFTQQIRIQVKMVQGIVYYVGNKIGKWKYWVSQIFLYQHSFLVDSNRN